MRQQLVLEDFPSPSTARALSPNGRAGWRARLMARHLVGEYVAWAVAVQGIRPVRGPVVLEPCWTFPVARRRDDDNLATGTVKAIRDSLVKLGVLEDDDTDHVRQAPARVEMTPGVRRLVVTIIDQEPG